MLVVGVVRISMKKEVETSVPTFFLPNFVLEVDSISGDEISCLIDDCCKIKMRFYTKFDSYF